MFPCVFHKFRRNIQGTISVEAALVLPVLILLGLGAVDYSNMLLSHHKMQSGITTAGNFLSRTSAPLAYEDTARNLALTGEVSGGNIRLKNWTAADISIGYKTISNTAGQYRGNDSIRVVTLTTSAPYNGLGLVNAIVPGKVIMRDTYEARIVGAAS